MVFLIPLEYFDQTMTASTNIFINLSSTIRSTKGRCRSMVYYSVNVLKETTNSLPMVLQVFGPWLLFQFLDPIYSR
jgi:hypothetical protein